MADSTRNSRLFTQKNSTLYNRAWRCFMSCITLLKKRTPRKQNCYTCNGTKESKIEYITVVAMVVLPVHVDSAK